MVNHPLRIVDVQTGDTKIYEGVTLIVYARENTLKNINTRRKGGMGDISHEEQIREQKSHLQRQEQEVEQYEREKKQKEGR